MLAPIRLPQRAGSGGSGTGRLARSPQGAIEPGRASRRLVALGSGPSSRSEPVVTNAKAAATGSDSPEAPGRVFPDPRLVAAIVDRVTFKRLHLRDRRPSRVRLRRAGRRTRTAG